MTGINDTLVFKENSGVVDFTAVIPQGFYSAPQYANILQTTMNAVLGIANSYSVSYNPNTLKFTITVNLPNTFSTRRNSTMLNENEWAHYQLNTFTTTKIAAYYM